MTIKEIYKENCKEEWYKEILPYIKRLIKKNDIILEFGTWFWIVSSAILDWMGKYSKLISFDIISTKRAKQLKDQAIIERKYFSYMEGSGLEVVVNDVDLMVTDSLHNANQLWAELIWNSNGVKRYIAIVGTNKYSRKWQSEGHLWLDDAIDKFIEWHNRNRKLVVKEWLWLTVLERIKL